MSSEEKKVKKYSDVMEEVEKSYKDRKEFSNKKGDPFIPRKYHLTDEQANKKRDQWLESISEVDPTIRDMVHKSFFNPYRKNGCYYGGVQALFLLGGNLWHKQKDVMAMMQKDMSSRIPQNATNKEKRTAWELFDGKNDDCKTSMDSWGRVGLNFRTMQRLGGLHSYGYKLKQVHACIDIKKENGHFYFRLRTSDKIEDLVPYFNVFQGKRGRKKKIDPMAPDTKNEAPDGKIKAPDTIIDVSKEIEAPVNS